MTSPDPVVTPVVHVVDDDDDLRQSLVFLFESVGIEALTYPDATSFLEEFDPDEPAVVIVDVRMPGMSGFQLQQHLIDRGYPAPMIFCSAHGDIPMSVRALNRGAVDFLEKPYDHQRMIDVVQTQLEHARERFAESVQRRELAGRLDTLTAREREVLALVIRGLSSRAIARELGASAKTVDVHRARIKAKTEAETLGVLVRDILVLGLDVETPA
ncbi:response regulator [Nocardioides sp. CER19]|uniref:response regulator transcription factor n=1 Tax=Nocardioides sp. CER19 TaxID=3038538 RepID=UPI0024493F7E|nr:response regulator [Nocardioides sp. CER19]MDH2414364.1 response regulator [Nocardioides sp. CER19]